MCGIYGWNIDNGEVGRRQRSILASVLGIQNDSRGGHSWGAFDGATTRHGMGSIGTKAWTLGTHMLLAAHTRFATHGEKNLINAHPFKVSGANGVVIGAHNGVIYNHTSLNTEFNRKFDVDSLHIFQHLVDGRDMSDLTGYGTIWWWEKNRLHLCKMTETADLSVCGLTRRIKRRSEKDKDVYAATIFSSKQEHIKSALLHAGLMKRAFFYKIEVGKVYIVEPTQLVEAGRELRISAGVGKAWYQYTSGSRSQYFAGHDWDDENDASSVSIADLFKKEDEKEREREDKAKEKVEVDDHKDIVGRLDFSVDDTAEIGEGEVHHVFELSRKGVLVSLVKLLHRGQSLIKYDGPAARANPSKTCVRILTKTHDEMEYISDLIETGDYSAEELYDTLAQYRAELSAGDAITIENKSDDDVDIAAWLAATSDWKN